MVAHGVGSSPRFIREAFAAPLAALGYRLVAYDLRGHGASTPLPDPGDHAFDAHVADLAAVADEVGARVVGGVSLGGHAAAAVAAERSDLEGLIVCLPAWTGTATRGDGPHAVIASEVRRGGVEPVLDRLAGDGSVPQWLAELLGRDWRTHPAASLAAALTALDGGEAPTGATLARVTVPTGIVGWPDDPGHPLEVATAWAAAMPGAKLVTTTLDAVGEGRTALGAAAVRALLSARRSAEPGVTVRSEPT
ncbi:MAG: alpha/beta hydrolase [Actinobacteria bacterium]|nr:alpha/beta hydrolase [Actinomycetota bacterium]